MEQKKINERITLSLLQQCALIWEYCSKSDKEGEFSFADVCAGVTSKLTKKVMEKTGYVEVDPWSCQWPEVLKQKMQAIDGMACYDEDEGRISLFFETDEQNPGIGFRCGFMLRGVFDVTRGFALKTGCQALTRKAVFGYKDGERWARVPSPAPAEPAKPAKAKSKSKKKVTITEKQLEPTLAERLRQALLAMMAA